MHSTTGRMSMSKRNIAFSVLARIVGMVTSFIGRSVFVSALGSEYLGLGGFFGNIFAIISLCEIGIGSAVAQSLYKPLAQDDEYTVCAIMHYFSKAYAIVAFLSFAISFAFLPFVGRALDGAVDYKTAVFSFLLFATHNFVSYLLAPKRALVVCDMRLYVVTAIRCVFCVIALALQCIVLLTTKNYILYLSARIASLNLENIAVNIYADKKYPFLNIKKSVSHEYKTELFTNVKALCLQKSGIILSQSTDSIIVSYFMGLSCMGKYSNYALVIGTVVAFFDVATNALGASVGNLGVCDRGQKSEDIFKKMYFINFWLLTVGTSVLVSTLNPFIRLWLGENMVFTSFEMLAVVSSFYFSCIRDPVGVFLSNYGLFKQGKYIPILRALANLVLSVAFVKMWGVAGVFIGTAVSAIAVPLWAEVKVLYKHGFFMSPKNFFCRMFCFIAMSFVICSFCFALTLKIESSLFGIFLRAVLSFSFSNIILFLCTHKENSFKGAYATVKCALFSRAAKAK